MIPDDMASMARRVGARSLLVVVARGSGCGCGCAQGWEAGDAALIAAEVDIASQLPRRFDLAWLDSSVRSAPPEVQRAGLHQAVQHLVPGGHLGLDATEAPGLQSLCDEFELEHDLSESSPSMLVLRRPMRTTVHDLLFEARSMIDRVDAPTLWHRLSEDHPPLVIDTRTHVDRARTGVIAGSIHVPRTVLEWHLDPANGYRHPAVISFDQPIVVVCNGGYSSSLAAANLCRIGFTNVADLIGGMHAWCANGLSTEVPDHSHLDL